ncbi:hypothetical protein BT63DRAFT_451779 [Microthyrium microscopicum]|uniref:Uncharacterized protein n=1 Tax=Microthyrium microscopicum TaxID=703497 RepID=A0A6A6UPL9_9PEZI|nr:hypothetical protein BT63DRAFT_451779 [Microthyrium microscopicum]
MSTPPPQDSAVHTLKKWGENSFIPVIQASLIASQHLKPLQVIGGIFFPVALLGSAYVGAAGYKKDAGGITAGLSGLYILLASRRQQRLRQKFFSTRGVIRGATLGLCAVNVVGCGLAYTFGDRAKEAEERGE